MDSIKKKMQSLATETERAQVFVGLHKYKYRVSIKKMYFSDVRLISVLEVGFCLFRCVMEAKFRDRFI